MNNAEKFKQMFGFYATEMWAKSEQKFLDWINAEYVQQENSWIPCSERLPDEDLWIDGNQLSNRVQMTVYDKNDGEIIIDYGYTVDGEWYSDTADVFIESIADWKVIAWMPLPEPYKEEES